MNKVCKAKMNAENMNFCVQKGVFENLANFFVVQFFCTFMAVGKTASIRVTYFLHRFAVLLILAIVTACGFIHRDAFADAAAGALPHQCHEQDTREKATKKE